MTTCLICGTSLAEVRKVQKNEGYTLGCGIESNTENGYSYDELSPRHRWKPWADKHLKSAGIKTEAYEKYRTSIAIDLQYADCNDRIRGHNYVKDASKWGPPKGTCWDCGKRRDEK